MPHGWLPVTATTTYTIVTGGRSCNQDNNAPTKPGDLLRFAWLDRGGRVSALSKPVRVGTRK